MFFFALLDPEIPWVAFYCNGKSPHVRSESFAHSDGCESSRLMLVADAVEPDLRAVRRWRRALHPRVVDYVLEGRPFCGAQGQAPLDKLLALCK